MSKVTISHSNHSGMTMVSNRFIDEYMKDANDTQVKIYLYLLRAVDCKLPSGISDIADYFNHTEKDILRALKYWDKLHVLTLLYDDKQELHGIRLEDLESQQETPVTIGHASPSQGVTVSFSPKISSLLKPASKPEESFVPMSKDSITLDQLKSFQNKSDTEELLFIIEQYVKTPLSSNDIRTIFFISDVLHFSKDMIDYLVQYCVEQGKKDFRYIEKVAINWANEGIFTPEDAAAQAKRYDKNTYTIMNNLGKNTVPTSHEIAFIKKWTEEYGFSLAIILEACQRTVLATDKHRFEYADRIMESWFQASVHDLKDIAQLDDAFQKKKGVVTSNYGKTTNSFNQFKQNQYDYDELLQRVKVN